MADLEFFTPLDSRLDKEFKSTTTLESGTNLSSVSFTNRSPTRTNGSTTEDDPNLYRGNKEVLVPNGFNSVLFLPLLDAVFKPNNLKKELVVKIDLQELSKALLVASSASENAFAVVGNHVKGLCMLLFHQVKYLSADFSLYSKRLVGTDLAVVNKPESSKYYESDDEFKQKAKKKPKKRKLRDADSVTTIQDYSDKYHSQLVPIERLEMLRMMNLGLAANDMFFMNNEVSPILKDYLNEMHLPNKVTAEKDWLSFDDLRMLSSPFKLNGYSFTPNMDDATVAATSELSFSTSYDIDWSLRNDPLNYRSGYYENYYNSYFEDDNFNQSEALALEDYKVKKKRKGATLRLFDVDLVRTDIKYDRKPTVYKPKRKAGERTRSAVREKRSGSVQQNRPLPVVEPQVDVKQRTLNQMFDNYFSSLVNADAANLTSQLAGSASGTSKLNNNELEYNRWDEQLDTEEAAPDIVDSMPDGETHRPPAEDRPSSQPENEELYEVAFQDTADGYGTLDVLNWLRETFRKSDFGSIKFDKLAKGLKASKASVVFLRVLILANSNFVSVSQEREVITIVPAERFWEPVSIKLSLPVGS